MKAKLLEKYQTFERFVRFVAQHFIQDDCTYVASALAFTTILAIVPLMSVGLAVFSSFPIFKGLTIPVQNFIFDNFVPATGKVVQLYLQQFTSQVTNLPVFGLIFLVITALLVLFTIERAMNKIWRVSSPRHGVTAFLLYWTILSLTPIMLGLSVIASSYVFSIPFFASHQAPSHVMHWAPFVLSLGGFTFLYLVVPNCPVSFREAFWGGLFAAISFEATKQAFAFYLSQYNTYELLYGAFAAVPIFFIWIYWVWIITLLGAEICYALSVHHQRRGGKALDGFSHALLWMHQLWMAQQKGKGLPFNKLIDASLQPFAVDAGEMVRILDEQGLMHAAQDGTYMLSRDMSTLSLYDLSRLLPYRLPTHLELHHAESSLSDRWSQVFKKTNEELAVSLDISLESLFKVC